ncbi:hypothetical protein CDIK_1976 [Cucumispora dikerogammari]|nr:hypothetical protein CDIK_1976 [Cucumispora dikerogammari]
MSNSSFFDFEEKDTITPTPSKGKKDKKAAVKPGLKFIICELEEEMEELTIKNAKSFNKKLEGVLKTIKPNKKQSFLKDFLEQALTNSLVSKPNVKRIQNFVSVVGEEEDVSESGNSIHTEYKATQTQHKEENVSEHKQELLSEKDRDKSKEYKEKHSTKEEIIEINKNIIQKMNNKESPVAFLNSLTIDQLTAIPPVILLKALAQTKSTEETNSFLVLFKQMNFTKGIWEAHFKLDTLIESEDPIENIFYLITSIKDEKTYKTAVNFYLENFTDYPQFDKFSYLSDTQNTNLGDGILKGEFLIGKIVNFMDYDLIENETPFGLIKISVFRFEKKIILLKNFADLLISKNREILGLLIYSSITKFFGSLKGQFLFKINLEEIELRKNKICCKYFDFFDKNEYFYSKMVPSLPEGVFKETNLFAEVKRFIDSYKKFDRNVLIEKSCLPKMEIFRALFYRIEGGIELSDDTLNCISL